MLFRSTGYLPSSRKLILVSVLVAAVAFVFITNNGIDYVAWPRLVVLDDTLNYAGKGFECVDFAVMPLTDLMCAGLQVG